MTPDEIYTKIIAKGMLGGWQAREDMGENFSWNVSNGIFFCKSTVWSEKNGRMEDFIVGCNVEKIIFDHSFARAIWPHSEPDEWENHIKDLVLSEDRIKFLEQFI